MRVSECIKRSLLEDRHLSMSQHILVGAQPSSTVANQVVKP